MANDGKKVVVVVPPGPMDSFCGWRRGGGGGEGVGVGEVFSVEDYQAARSLLMLARGVRDEAADEDGYGSLGGVKGVGGGVEPALGPHRLRCYECSVCGKVYSSYQALGGHKTCHRKTPRLPAPAPNHAADPVAVAPPLPPLLRPSSFGGIREAKVHRCSVCFCTFSSGQALGGHKRLHYNQRGGAGGGDAKKPKPAATTPRTVKDFDLNLPATGTAAQDVNEIPPPPAAKKARTLLLMI
ncbi:hypothetical protein GUJ93_ZPchr0013g34821 [Zizania palustris]|uniref:C2H2-type domain-containing protein n=1 Tax=Zizania palustris TaxID=103762 RepID=A0A8J5X230_ZIZPA|nr:hypothetical protein GUJ93_ZPchr0013g36039 [Zizania palustris]KAG8099507.1 hypothetical protein GUJ93_ZPchr0013g34821 [Zizania palustris]